VSQPNIPAPEFVDNLLSVFQIIGPLIACITALIVWAWRKMEKGLDKLEDALTKHIDDDDKIHDKLFDQDKDICHNLDVLTGEHNRQKRSC
jgi:hypothetical protein